MGILSGLLKICSKLISLLSYFFDFFSHFARLAIRIYLFNAFFFSGWDKMKHFDTTLETFARDYTVPYLSSETAAYLATGSEILLPIFLFIGLGARIPAIGLLCFIGTALYANPPLWHEANAALFNAYILQAALCAVILFFGHSKISVDHLLYKLHEPYHY